MTILLPARHRRLLAAVRIVGPLAVGFAVWLWLAWRLPIANPVMLPLASLLTLGACGLTGFLLWNARAHPVPWETPPLPGHVTAGDWQSEPGSVLIGVTDDGPHTETHDGMPFAVWDKDPHLLLAGSTGAGKSATVRWLARSLLASGYRVAGFDGKGSGAMRPLEGRERIVGVADTRAEWTELIGRVKAEMDEYYDQLRAYRSGRGPQPEPVRIAVLADELVDIIEQTKNTLFRDPVSAIARMGREADIRIVASVLRPDVAEALPGLVKAQMRARVALGTPTPQTGQMLFEDNWAKVRAVMDTGYVPGRGVALLSGRACRVQLPWVADPSDGENGWLPPLTAIGAPRRGDVAARAAALRQGGASYRVIAETLIAEGYSTPSGRPWTPQAAQRTLTKGT